MKNYLLLSVTLFILFSEGLQAQSYGNEWINYNQTYYKIKISQDGLYRDTYSVLQQSGIPVSTINGSDFQIFGRGQEVPMYVSTNSILSNTDYIEFYALKNDGALDSNMYENTAWQGNVRLSLFNDTAAYFLTYNSSVGHLRLTQTTNNISGHPAKENWCWYLTENIYGQARLSSTYSKGKPDIQGQPIFNSDLSDGEGYTQGWFTLSANTVNLYTPFPYVSGPTAKFKSSWIGRFPGAHLLDLSIGGTLQQTYSYADFHTETADLSISSNSLIGNGTTSFIYSTVNSPTYYDNNGISYLNLKYPRQFNFDNNGNTKFSLPSSVTNKYIEIYNFNDQSTVPVLYDFTNRLRLTPVISGDTLKFLLPPSATERQLLVVAQTPGTDILLVNSMQQKTFTDYTNPVNQGDFIIISHPFFFDDGSGNNYVQQYKDFKNSTGYQAIVANIEELYDQFSYGVEMHPISIRNFSKFINDTWAGTTTKNIFIIGKGIEFLNYNDIPASKPHNYIPTWAWPGSDILLTSTNTNQTPLIAIGRIPALNTTDIKNYLEKAQQFVAAQNAPQTIADKSWMKRVLHLGGGENLQDQTIFQYYLNSYKPIIEDTLFGGKVYSFFKTSSDPIATATSDYLDSLINTGVSLINFFGHSSYNSFDFNLDHPENYSNYGKYPMILSNGCLLGNLFYDGTGLSDEFVFAHNAGAIAFLAAATFSISNSLDVYTNNFYQNLSVKSYYEPIGTVIKNSINDILNNNPSGVDRTVLEQMGLNGDPSLKLNTHPLPDYVIEPSSVSFNPGIVSAGVDSFALNLVITNIGKAIHDSIFVDITRIFPNGQQYLVAHKKIAATYFLDTLTFNIKTNAFTALGLNQFSIKVESDNHIVESSETNNNLTVDLLILSDDIIPVYPYEFSIVNHQSVTLKASTVNAFATSKQYVFQIDTTENFNSSLFQEIKINQIGGVAKWTPAVTLHDSTVYYWRTSLDTLYNNGFSWHNSSFIYINGSSLGWNQSHYFQYLKDKFGSIELPANRIFKYADDFITVGVYNGITNYYTGGPLGWDEPSYFINNVRMANWTCGTGANLMFAVIDSLTGLQWESVNQGTGYGQYGNIHCWPQNLNAFYFNGNDPASFPAIEAFIDTIPQGNYVLAMTLNNAGMPLWDQGMKDAFHTIGGMDLDTITTTEPYVLFSKKGSPNYPATEIIGDSFSAIIDTSFIIQGAWDRGYLETPLIGPAKQWTSLHWKKHEIEVGADSINLELIGIDNNGISTVLLPTILAADTIISGIDASVYPYLKMRLSSTDTTNRTPVQLDAWRINYMGVPEAALNPAAYLSFSDTVNIYQNMKLDIALENVSDYDMDSITMKYNITDATNQAHIVYNKLDSLNANDTLHTSFYFPISSGVYNGLNSIIMDANPFDNHHQLEQYHFNNLGALRFTASKDLINPFLDVTFDGVRILDADIVSAKPEINIQLKDNNLKLLINDTSLMKIHFVYPDGSYHRVIFDGTQFVFVAADSTQLNKSNNAAAILKPVFALDGIYHLFVQGYDRSGNASGNFAYQVSFEVINKQMISNVLNYPNPFTTQTRFVFTLTGSVVPDFMKIQILNVSGKVVREIFKDELGNLHIGRNMTDFAWDGTDQYGDALANGLYIYRVIANANNETIDKYDTGTDKYFKNGIGKMYLMR